jgi:hypothetical protein
MFLLTGDLAGTATRAVIILDKKSVLWHLTSPTWNALFFCRWWRQVINLGFKNRVLRAWQRSIVTPIGYNSRIWMTNVKIQMTNQIQMFKCLNDSVKNPNQRSGLLYRPQGRPVIMVKSTRYSSCLMSSRSHFWILVFDIHLTFELWHLKLKIRYSLLEAPF